jgi:hypothetical protein
MDDKKVKPIGRFKALGTAGKPADIEVQLRSAYALEYIATALGVLVEIELKKLNDEE